MKRSKITNKPSPAPAASQPCSKLNGTKKQQLNLRNPLHDLNTISSCSTETSSSISVEAPKCCLRFFLSHSSSSKTPIYNPKTLSKTPKSAPNLLPSKKPSKLQKENLAKRSSEENPPKPRTRRPHKKLNYSPSLYQWHPRKKPSLKMREKTKTLVSSVDNGNSLGSLASGSEDLEHNELKPCGDDLKFTPLSKTASGSDVERKVDTIIEENSETSNSKTPPIQPSVSPEMQCGSSMVYNTTTPACYGAGYVVSGVTDKRKCRPKGILTVGDNDSGICKVSAFYNGDYENGDEKNIGVTNDGVVSMVTSPMEASVNWLLSPSNKNNKDQREKSDNSSCQSESLTGSMTHHFHGSSLSADALSSDVCNHSDDTVVTKCRRRKSNLLISPETPVFRGFLDTSFVEVPILSSPECAPSCKDVSVREERRKQSYGLDGEKSPFSLGSGNVIRTPQSDSSSDRQIGLSLLHSDNWKKCQFSSEVNSVTELLQMSSLSPNNTDKSIRGQRDPTSPFNCLATVSNSIDLNQFQNILGDWDYWNSNSSLENVSHSHSRISWREGLVRQNYEMDEFDCCRCLSEEEEEQEDRETHQSPEVNVDVGGDKILSNDCGPNEFVNDELEVDEKVEDGFPHQISCACAESFSTDGGGMIASGDSDWNLCYKNHMFDL